MTKNNSFYTRGTSLLMIFCMIFTMIPVASLAENNYYQKAATQSQKAAVKTVNGNFTVDRPGKVIQNMIIKGKLIITANVGNGNVTLNNVKVIGDTRISGGRNIFVNDSLLKTATVVRKTGNVSIVASGASSITEVRAASGVALLEKDITGSAKGFRNVVVTSPAGSLTKLAGKFDKVTSSSFKARIQLQQGSTASWLVLNARASITGKGIVLRSDINAAGTTFETAPKVMIVKKGVAQPKITGQASVKTPGLVIALKDVKTTGRLMITPNAGEIRLVASGSSSIAELRAASGAVLEEKNLAGSFKGFRNVIVTAPSGDKMTLIGKFETVTVGSKNVNINIPEGSTVNRLVLNKSALVTGSGVVKLALVNASGVVFETMPVEKIIAKGVAEPTMLPVPPAPAVSRDDTQNSVSGMAAGMEYSLNGSAYVPYEKAAFDALSFDGANTLLVRISAVFGVNKAGLVTMLTFTENPKPAPPAASPGGGGGGSVPTVNKSALASAISAAEAKLASAVEGTVPGQYEAGSKAIYKLAIDAAKAVNADALSTQAAVDKAQTDLAAATTAFSAAIVPLPNKTALAAAIAAAEAKLAAALEGTVPGQYAAGSKAIYKLAIDAANAVNGNAVATQAEVDGAVTALAAATAAFDAAMVPFPIPAAPAVIADDILNTVSGMKTGFEYRLDGATAYTAYDKGSFKLIDLSGSHTLLVRVAAVAGVNQSGLDTTLVFTPNIQAQGKLLITFDGAYASQGAAAKDILDGAGYKATMYVSGSVIGVGDYMTLDNLKAMYGAGWDIANMTFNYNANGSTTDSALFVDLVKSYEDNQKWLVDNGLARGALHAAYPYGLYTSALIESLKTKGVLTGRTYVYGTVPDTISGNAFYELPMMWLSSTGDAGFVIAEIDKAVANGGTVIVNVTSTDPDYAGLQAVVTHARTLSDAGSLKVMTVSEWFGQPSPVAPEAPNVSADDTLNTVTGMAAGMEYSLDYAPYVPYDSTSFAAVDLSGDHALMVRYAASGINPAGPATTLRFTTNQVAKAAKIIFTFDDGWRDNLTYALPVFEEAGIRGTVYASKTLSNYYDGNLIMQESELQQLYDAGWDIGNHTTTHENIGNLTDEASLATLKTIYESNQNWLLENGWIRGAYHAAYPSGLYSDALIEILKSIGVKSSRAALESGTIPESTLFIPGSKELFTMPVMYLETAAGEDMAGDLIEAIDTAASNGEDIFVLLHRVGPVAADMTVTTEDLQKVVKHAKALSDKGQISIMTVSEWYDSVVK